MGKNYRHVLHQLRISVALCAVVSALAVHAQAKPNLCARPRVLSGGDCKDLRIEFDLTRCGDMAVGAPKISCSEGSAEVTQKGQRNEYAARFKSKDSGAWGGDPVWTQVGRTKVHALQKTMTPGLRRLQKK